MHSGTRALHRFGYRFPAFLLADGRPTITVTSWPTCATRCWTRPPPSAELEESSSRPSAHQSTRRRWPRARTRVRPAPGRDGRRASVAAAAHHGRPCRAGERERLEHDDGAGDHRARHLRGQRPPDLPRSDLGVGVAHDVRDESGAPVVRRPTGTTAASATPSSPTKACSTSLGPTITPSHLHPVVRARDVLEHAVVAHPHVVAHAEATATVGQGPEPRCGELGVVPEAERTVLADDLGHPDLACGHRRARVVDHHDLGPRQWAPERQWLVGTCVVVGSGDPLGEHARLARAVAVDEPRAGPNSSRAARDVAPVRRLAAERDDLHRVHRRHASPAHGLGEVPQHRRDELQHRDPPVEDPFRQLAPSADALVVDAELRARDERAE